MILTEKEAKTKWCPMARTGLLAGAGAVAVNRHITDDEGYKGEVYHETRCMGSDCAMWVWFSRNVGDQDADRQGHCGLVPGGAPT